MLVIKRYRFPYLYTNIYKNGIFFDSRLLPNEDSDAIERHLMQRSKDYKPMYVRIPYKQQILFRNVKVKKTPTLGVIRIINSINTDHPSRSHPEALSDTDKRPTKTGKSFRVCVGSKYFYNTGDRKGQCSYDGEYGDRYCCELHKERLLFAGYTLNNIHAIMPLTKPLADLVDRRVKPGLGNHPWSDKEWKIAKLTYDLRHVKKK